MYISKVHQFYAKILHNSLMIKSVRVVGAGLIGTSIGLALKSASIDVEMVDSDLRAQEFGTDLVKGQPVNKPDVIVVCVPISQTEQVVLEQLKLNPDAIVCDIASVKSDLQLKVEAISDRVQNFISLHPMAGREIAGAEGARADLFQGRAWIAIKNQATSKQAISAAEELIKLCGATIYWLTSDEHDLLVAKISHLPQILSSAIAGQLRHISVENLNIAGQGLRDVTRLAQSDSSLWSEILLQNRKAISTELIKIIENLNNLYRSLEDKNIDEVVKFLLAGVEGKKRIPGKHGGVERNYSNLAIVIDDKPGELARIFNECANVLVNIEDLNIEHSPGQETGLITLSLSESDCSKLLNHLDKQGFKVYRSKNR